MTQAFRTCQNRRAATSREFIDPGPFDWFYIANSTTVAMLSRPFRPPLLKHLPHASSKKADDQCDEPPAKRRRISEEGFDEESSDATLDLALPKCKPISKSAFGPRKPLVVVKNPPDLAGTEKSQEEGGAEGWYNVLWYCS